VGLKRFVLAALLAASSAGAAADEIDDCEALGKTQLSESSFDRPFEIDREKLYFDKAEAQVGSQFVSSVLHGPANMDTGGEMESVRFVCLHGGTGVGALFVWFLPD
jgi:hypothetical protein